MKGSPSNREMAEDLDVEAMLEAPFKKDVSSFFLLLDFISSSDEFYFSRIDCKKKKSIIMQMMVLNYEINSIFLQHFDCFAF